MSHEDAGEIVAIAGQALLASLSGDGLPTDLEGGTTRQNAVCLRRLVNQCFTLGEAFNAKSKEVFAEVQSTLKADEKDVE